MPDFRERLEASLSGSYVLQRELGGGGMSRVFVAEEQKLGRTVVVKLLSPDLAAAMSASRFEREIRVAASLQQANIVPVLTSGDADGLPYYTMPFVEGESLRTRLGRGPLSIAEVASILRDVARALAYAHERGVVHRDIKPDNVLLSGHTAVVTDFGIAKAIAAASEGPTGATLTQLGTAVGTPAYMAPEQAAGDPATDHRADIYAFGCMAYELLGGKSPFAGLPPHKLMVAHMSEAPRPISQLRPDCPPALAALVMQCVAKDPAARPANAAELLHRLDAVASPAGGGAAMPAILIGGPGMIWRALGLYAVAFIGVAIVARAAIIAVGLPDWVFPGALIVMALGLPIILFTAFTQHVARQRATATPTWTPGGTPSLAEAHGTLATLAIKASPHLSWQRTVRGGVVAIGAFVLLVASFMTLRALGIGPAGSLLAAGKLAANDNVIVAAFDSPGADSSLGATIAEAVKTNLSQSHAVRVMPTGSVVAALQQMKRPDTSRVDLTVARDIAQRTGAKAVIAGRIVPAGVGYVITIRLVGAESGNDLASFSESAKDPGDLIPAVDRITRALRGRIGESLKAVRASPPLDQVTTASLGALRSYSAGLRENDVNGNYLTAVDDFNDAIRQDSSFAMAYVQLAYSLNTIGGTAHQTAAHAAMSAAFRLRDRLTETERYNVEGGYYLDVANDRGKAIAALTHSVQLDSTNFDAQNTLGVTLANVRDSLGAVQAYKRSIAYDSADGTILANLSQEYAGMGRFAEADSVVALIASRHVPFPISRLRYSIYWLRHQYDSAEKLARNLADSADPLHAASALNGMVMVTQLRGRLREAERFHAQAIAAAARARADTASPAVLADFLAGLDGVIRGNTARAIADIDSVLHAHPMASLPLADDGSPIVAVDYALLGAPEKARALLRQYETRLDTLSRHRQAVPLARARGAIALAEGKTDSAIAWIRRGDVEADGLPTSNRAALTPFLLGTTYDRAHLPDSARKYLTAYVEMPGGGRLGVDPVLLGPTLLRLGQLYRDAGDSQRAIDYYTRFIDLWKNADAELQPRVAEARKELADVVKAKG